MARNTEIKARISSLEALLPIATALADGGPPRHIEQDDTFFHVHQGRLKLREFADGSAELIHYHRPDAEGPKVSDYVISPVADAASMRLALGRACGQLGRVRKQRTLLLAGQTRIHLDRVEGLGDFLELEVVLRDGQSAEEGVRIAQGLMQQLGVQAGQLLSGAYLDLLGTATQASKLRPVGAA